MNILYFAENNPKRMYDLRPAEVELYISIVA